MPTHKLISLPEAVRRFTADGMQYASGASLPVGADAIAFGRELLRQGRHNLHGIFHCNSQQLNLLAATGMLDRVECGFTGLEGFGFANGLRRAVESGQLALEDYSNLSMALRFLAGSLNLPFMPATVNIGSDIARRSAFSPNTYPATDKIPTITDPFSGRSLGALSPLKPDLAAIHVTLADVQGNAIMIGTEWSRFELSRAAQKVILITDHIVDTDCMRQYPNLVRIPGIIVEAVVWWPYAAWPQGSPGVHDIDEAHMKLMNQWLATEDGTARYLKQFVHSYTNLDDYLDLIGRDVIESINHGPTGFLLDPFRQWIQPRATIEAVLADTSSTGSVA